MLGEYRGKTLTDQDAMQLALRAARQGVRGANPLVGALILSPDNRVLHLGWHRGAGSAHAEADVLAQAQAAGTSVRGCRMVVTLEPCRHWGRTGPCATAIAQAGITELVYASADRTQTARGGADYLRSWGIRVVDGLLQEQALSLNARWFRATGQGRPFVTAKIASSADGFIAASDGSSRWITGPQARADGHRLRARADAVLVGGQTLLADDPRLTARLPPAEGVKQPLAAVMGLRLPPLNTYLGAEIQAGRALHLKTRDPLEALHLLSERGVGHLLIEGGPTLLTAFLAADLVDELVWYRAPLLLGAGRLAVGDLGIENLGAGRRWALDDLGARPALRLLGQDTVTHMIAVQHEMTTAPTEL